MCATKYKIILVCTSGTNVMLQCSSPAGEDVQRS